MKEEDFPANLPIFWTIGAFDGVHLGHQALIHTTVNLARATQKKSGVLTFSPHPDVVLKKKNFEYITTEEEKKEILHNLGVDYVWTLKFTRELARFTWKKFLEEIFLPRTLCAGIIVGQDFTFGNKAEGNASLLKEYMEQKGVPVEICAEVQCKGRKVSSTWVRETLLEGKVDLTRMLLGRPYSINSTVVKGTGKGRKLGFPTMNLSPVPEKILPRFGVYVVLSSGKDFCYPGLGYVGTRPTFASSHQPVVEIYVDGEVGVRYGETIRVAFCKFLREDRAFPSEKELKRQMEKDFMEMKKYVHSQSR